MSADLLREAAAERTVETPGPLHGRCMTCYPKPGSAIALCGTRYIATDRYPVNHIPVDSCLRCVALVDAPCSRCGAPWEGA